MRERLALVCTLVVTMGCSNATAPSPTARANVQPPLSEQYGTQAFLQSISLGQEVRNRLVAHDTYSTFELTVPVDGQVTAHVTWDPADGLLEVWLGDRNIAPDDQDGSIAAGFSVSAGQTYRFIVADAAPWDYGPLDLPFTLTTSMDAAASP